MAAVSWTWLPNLYLYLSLHSLPGGALNNLDISFRQITADLVNKQMKHFIGMPSPLWWLVEGPQGSPPDQILGQLGLLNRELSVVTADQSVSEVGDSRNRKKIKTGKLYTPMSDPFLQQKMG